MQTTGAFHVHAFPCLSIVPPLLLSADTRNGSFLPLTDGGRSKNVVCLLLAAAGVSRTLCTGPGVPDGISRAALSSPWTA